MFVNIGLYFVNIGCVIVEGLKTEGELCTLTTSQLPLWGHLQFSVVTFLMKGQFFVVKLEILHRFGSKNYIHGKLSQLRTESILDDGFQSCNR